VAPTNNMRVRFRTADTVGTVVEAAVDELEIIDYDCTPPDVLLFSISPASGPFEGGNQVLLTGTGFQAGVTTVQFGQSAPVQANVLNPSQLQVIVPRARGAANNKARSLTVDVTVQNPGSDTAPKAYSYRLNP
jgi:IPT/TIG domain